MLELYSEWIFEFIIEVMFIILSSRMMFEIADAYIKRGHLASVTVICILLFTLFVADFPSWLPGIVPEYKISDISSLSVLTVIVSVIYLWKMIGLR